MTRILVLGAAGMLGHEVLRTVASSADHEVWGASRQDTGLRERLRLPRVSIISGFDVGDADSLVRVISEARPELVINCVGLVKQLAAADDPLVALPVNALFPHRLARLCGVVGARLIHVSTDCVFSGDAGHYCESDVSDARDLYGKSKLIGELTDYAHAITLRTSIIGHELGRPHGLVDWFLSQSGTVKGYTRAIFSGLPTTELARVMRDVVLPRPALRGLYHVAAEPIAKLDLLRLVASVYRKTIDIVPDSAVAIDRSLDGSRFTAATGYAADSWPRLVESMHATRHPS